MSFPWYSRTWEIWFLVQCRVYSGNGQHFHYVATSRYTDGHGYVWSRYHPRKQAARSTSQEKSWTLKGNQENIWLHIWWKQFACSLERQQSCHCCPQLFIAKSSFVNKALVESWGKACRHTNIKSFQNYNANMGGVDLFDQFVSTYCVRICSKKCWSPFFARSINATAVNAWRLFRKIHGNNIPLLKFHANLCLKLWESMTKTDQHNLSTPLK